MDTRCYSERGGVMGEGLLLPVIRLYVAQSYSQMSELSACII